MLTIIWHRPPPRIVIEHEGAGRADSLMWRRTARFLMCRVRAIRSKSIQKPDRLVLIPGAAPVATLLTLALPAKRREIHSWFK